jgi:CheY-like chemotaxis protein
MMGENALWGRSLSMKSLATAHDRLDLSGDTIHNADAYEDGDVFINQDMGRQQVACEKGARGPIMAKTRILIMDDEELILDVVSSMLEYLCYEVELSKNGQEALEKYQASMQAGTPIGLVIMDLTIPGGRGGKDVIKDLLALDPKVRAIVSSGYSNDPIMANCTEYGFKGVVNKPFKMDDLRDALEQALKA